jgi:hypothetical protein
VPGLHEVQAAFADAMLNGNGTAGLTASILAAGSPAERRLGVYRANVMLSLRRLLEGTFPVTRRLLRADQFASVADAFVRQSPPTRPQLLAYGAGFPDAVDAVHRLIGDVARLEWAREEAYHAADAPTVDAAALAAAPMERYPALRFRPHPSLRLLRSPGPVYSLWSGDEGSGAQQVLVVRQEMTVVTRLVSAGDLALLTALAAGQPLAEAATAALAVEPGLDLQSALAGHLGGGSFAAFY